jgi:signal transduction histidine kinase
MNITDYHRSYRRRSLRASRPSQHSPIAARREPAALEEILITYKLLSRRRRKPNSRDENIALRELAQVMATSPEKLVDAVLLMALELCTAGSSGLGLLETKDDGEQSFRWTNVAGALRKHVGAITPGKFSSSGVTLDRNAAQLFSYPERRFEYFGGLGCDIVEELVMPVYLREQTVGTIWIVSHDEEVSFDAEDVRIMAGLAEFASCGLQLAQSSQAQQSARVEGEKQLAAQKCTETTLRANQAHLQTDIFARKAQLQQLSARLMNLQDEERRRLARELHDSAGQYLAGIQMNLSALKRIDPPLSAEGAFRVSDSITLLNQCTSEIRTMSYLLHPPLLDECGLRSAISMFADGFAERSGIRVKLEIPDDFGRLSSEMETAIFRAIQQSLANVHKHSGSPVAYLRITADAEFVMIEISDEGCGIKPEILEGFHSGSKLTSVGIAGMRERIEGMNGDFAIHSGEKGTLIEIRLPLQPRGKSMHA